MQTQITLILYTKCLNSLQFITTSNMSNYANCAARMKFSTFLLLYSLYYNLLVMISYTKEPEILKVGKIYMACKMIHINIEESKRCDCISIQASCCKPRKMSYFWKVTWLEHDMFSFLIDNYIIKKFLAMITDELN